MKEVLEVVLLITMIVTMLVFLGNGIYMSISVARTEKKFKKDMKELEERYKNEENK